MSRQTDRIEEIAGELERVAEELSEAAMDILREAVFDGSEDRASEARRREKVLNRARASVEKAARLARQAADERGEAFSVEDG